MSALNLPVKLRQSTAVPEEAREGYQCMRFAKKKTKAINKGKDFCARNCKRQKQNKGNTTTSMRSDAAKIQHTLIVLSQLAVHIIDSF